MTCKFVSDPRPLDLLKLGLICDIVDAVPRRLTIFRVTLFTVSVQHHLALAQFPVTLTDITVTFHLCLWVVRVKSIATYIVCQPNDSGWGALLWPVQG